MDLLSILYKLSLCVREKKIKFSLNYFYELFSLLFGFFIYFNIFLEHVDFYDRAHVTSTNKYDIMRADRPMCAMGALYSYINLAEIFQESLSIFSKVF